MIINLPSPFKTFFIEHFNIKIVKNAAQVSTTAWRMETVSSGALRLEIEWIVGLFGMEMLTAKQT